MLQATFNALRDGAELHDCILPRDSTNYCIPRCNRKWPKDTRPIFPTTLPAMPINMGKKRLARETSTFLCFMHVGLGMRPLYSPQDAGVSTVINI